ncbi:MAG: FHA domain-containing protein [Planctomycetota bacterium]
MLILIVAGGPDKGRIYELADGQDVVLGREDADLQFLDPKVSRRHARLWSEGGRWYLADLDSRHGTHRNQQEIDGVQPLKDGDYIQVGKTVMVLTRASAESLHHADFATASQGRGLTKRTRLALVGGAAAAAAVLLSLGVASVLTARSQGDAIQQRLATLSETETPAQQKLRRDVELALETKREHERRVETMIAAFGPKTDRMLPKLDHILAVLDRQPDVVGPLTALAEAIELDRADDRTDAKLDAALAMLEARGGDAEALAERFRLMLDARPTVDQIAAAVRSEQDNVDTPAVLAAIAEVRDAMPPDPTPALASVAERLDAQPTGETMNAVTAQLTALAQQMRDRRDSELIQSQLDRLIEATRGRNEAEAQRALARAEADPVMGQVLAHVQALAAAEAKQQAQLDEVLASLKQQPYENRAMMDEALALLDLADADTPDTDVAALLEDTMAELRGKAITDADQLRRLIQREVVAAVGRTPGSLGSPASPGRLDTPRRPAADDTRLTKTETAYRLAFETGKKVKIGVVPEVPGSGRTLDPTDAVAAGHESWRDWYLMDDLAHRLRLDTAADRVAGSTRGVSRRVLSMPGDDEAAVSATRSIDGE